MLSVSQLSDAPAMSWYVSLPTIPLPLSAEQAPRNRDRPQSWGHEGPEYAVYRFIQLPSGARNHISTIQTLF